MKKPEAKPVHFDAEWYLKSHPDVGLTGLTAKDHYRKYGAILGRRPAESADVGAPILLQECAEGRSGQEPQEQSGKRTVPVASEYPEVYEDLNGARIRLRPRPCYESAEYDVSSYPLSNHLVTPWDDSETRLSKSPDIGIHLHLHYPELAEEFCNYLENVPSPFSLYVSVTETAAVEPVNTTLTERVPHAQIKVKYFPNRGRDIAAFVSGFAKDLAKHEFIAHFHSKVSPHNRAKADWRRQLMTYLCGRPSVVSQIFRTFETNPGVGMIFPVYHSSLRSQISWGGNFDACEKLAETCGIEVFKEEMTIFPAGSVFWCRSEAIRPLFDLQLSFEDFPEEQAQVDGTLAHAVERMLGEIVRFSGFSVLQTRSSKPFNLVDYHPNQWPIKQAQPANRIVEEYHQARRKAPKARIAIVTALSGGYEQPVLHERLDPNIDYLLFSDRTVNDMGFWQVRPMDWYHPEPVRMARRIKTNLQVYAGNYDWVVWIDANVIIRCDINKYIRAVQNSPATAIGAIPHPTRQCAYLEAKTVVQAGKDQSGRVHRQMQAYDAEGFPKNAGLIESNLMVFDFRNDQSEQVFSSWWAEINRYSHRDQLSLNYVLWKTGTAWLPLFCDNHSLRDSKDFAYLGHGSNSGYQRLETITRALEVDPLTETDMKPPAHLAIDQSGIDIVVCVHNAPKETRACLESVTQSMRRVDRLIVVDDGSDQETAALINELCTDIPGQIIRNPGAAEGYCKAANRGMEATRQQYFLLLNSDTLLSREALENMLSTIHSAPKTGLVGPMSNAASSQSIPEIGGSTGQTAINDLPPGQSIESMNDHCRVWSHPTLRPNVPLVHGFCQLIRRRVYEEIGGFDANSFPEGYGEENDFCLRAADSGWDLRICTDAYVFHSKSASYSDNQRRQQLMSKGSQKLREKHTEDRVAQAIKMMERHPLLQRMREKTKTLCQSGQAS